MKEEDKLHCEWSIIEKGVIGENDEDFMTCVPLLI